MTIHLISFTKNGAKISEKLSNKKIVFNNENAVFMRVFAGTYSESFPKKNKYINEDINKNKNENINEKINEKINENINDNIRKDDKIIQISKNGSREYIGNCFKNNEPIVFIGACGIAVRMIAPFMQSKLTDIPVIVIDELGKYVIPILSGHFGGANELANKIAKALKARCVITTATDIENKFAVDIFAKKNGLALNDKNMIAYISSKLLAGEKASLKICGDIFFDEDKIPDDLVLLPEGSDEVPDILVTDDKKDKNGRLVLVPKRFVLGIGCKKGKSVEDISRFVLNVLKKNHLSVKDVFLVSTIDLKKDEEGLKSFASKNRFCFVTYTAEELKKVKGVFSSSDFVRSKTGVDNVCERAAVKAAGRGGKLLLPKQSGDGVTVAVATRKVKLKFDL